jgi:general secretion pathway protein D
MILMPPQHYRRLTLIASILLATALTPNYALSEPLQKPISEKGESLNYRDVDIRTVISAMSKTTGKNFLIDPRVNGKITILSASPLRKESVYDVFLDALRTHNYVAIEQGNVVKIVPLEEAKQNPASTSKVIPGGAEQITRVVKIKSVSAAQLVPVLRPLMPREAYLQAYMDTNTLVLSDSEKNIQRLLGVIETIDRPNQDTDEIVPLYQANADEVLRILKDTQQKKTETSATITADKRSNSIIISGNKSERARYSSIIKNLDTPIANHSAHHVLPLKYAKAADLAPLLDKVMNKTGSGTSSGSSSTPNPAGGVSGTTSSGMSGANSSASNIIADEATNSLIISADMQNYQSMLEVLKQLDIPRKQVMIEAIIAEISTDNTQKLGVEWGVATNNGAGVANKPTKNAGLLGTVGALANSDLTKALLTGGFSALISKGDISVMLNAIKNDANTNILSAPQILTLDNKEAEMVVGENVPFVTGSYTTQASAGSTVNPFTTVQRQDVGLILKVKPQINQGGMITLEISQETSAVKDTTSNAGITTTKRSMKSNVSVADGNMLVLGGLMNNQMDDGLDSVPILGDIPLLGWLFKTQKTTSTKRTLMVFIRPTIIDSEDTNNPSTQKALSAIEQEQQLFNKKDMLVTPDLKRYQITPHIEPLPELDAAPKAIAR